MSRQRQLQGDSFTGLLDEPLRPATSMQGTKRLMRCRSGCTTSGCKQPRWQKSYLRRNLVVETSGKVYLEQNLTRELILRSVRPWLVKNHAKSAKTKFPIRNFRRNKIFAVEKRNVRNHPKRVLAKFRDDRSVVRDVNGCETTVVFFTTTVTRR